MFLCEIFLTLFIQHFADFRQPTVEDSVEHEARNYSYTRDHACHKQSYSLLPVKIALTGLRLVALLPALLLSAVWKKK